MSNVLREALVMAKIRLVFVAFFVVVAAFWGVGGLPLWLRTCLYGALATGTASWVASKLTLAGLMLMSAIEVARRQRLIAIELPGKA